MPEESQGPTRSPSGPPVGGDRPPEDQLESREAFLERIRTLRLWADHLEELLAQRTEQVEIWRERAEQRKARIAELTAGSAGPARRRRRPSLWPGRRRSTTSNEPTPVQPLPQTDREPFEQGPVAPMHRGPVHPTVRLGVLAPGGTGVPRLLERMNTRRIPDASSAEVVRSTDVLVVVGEEAARLAQAWEATRDWMDQGHPTVIVSTSLPGQVSVAESDLTYFDPSDDVFQAQPSPRPGVDPHLQPTLHRIDGMPSSTWSRILAERVAEGSSAAESERLAVQLLRELRSESSPDVVGERLLRAAGVAVPEWRREALAVLVSRRADFVVEAVGRLIRQSYRPLRLAVGLHGPASNAESAVRTLLEAGDIPHTVLALDASFTQGACLNELVAAAPGDALLKIDDDDFYSPVFVDDMMTALQYSGASIVGKAAAFVRLRSGDHVLLRNACYQAVDHVVGPTITAHRSAWDSVRFPNRHERVDSKFLQAARSQDLRVVAHHPWDFCVIRHDRGHSWTASDEYFMAAGRVVDIDWDAIQTA